MVDTLYWLLSDGSISITLRLMEGFEDDKLRPQSEAVLLSPKSIPDKLEQSHLWRYDKDTQAIYIDAQVSLDSEWNKVRERRDTLLLASDIELIRSFEQGLDLDDIKIYRQKLRDITKEYDLPSEVVWPNK